MKKISLLKILIVVLALSFGAVVYAQGQGGGANVSPAPTGGGQGGGANITPAPTNQQLPRLQNPLRNVNSVTDLLVKIVDLLIFLGVIVAVFMFIFVGFKFVWAQGNSDALSEARQWFLWVAVGTAILISSKVIVEVIKTTFISAGVVDERLFNRPN